MLTCPQTAKSPQEEPEQEEPEKEPILKTRAKTWASKPFMSLRNGVTCSWGITFVTKHLGKGKKKAAADAVVEAGHIAQESGTIESPWLCYSCRTLGIRTCNHMRPPPSRRSSMPSIWRDSDFDPQGGMRQELQQWCVADTILNGPAFLQRRPQDPNSTDMQRRRRPIPRGREWLEAQLELQRSRELKRDRELRRSRTTPTARDPQVSPGN
jgi:hypothetical protein